MTSYYCYFKVPADLLFILNLASDFILPWTNKLFWILNFFASSMLIPASSLFGVNAKSNDIVDLLK